MDSHEDNAFTSIEAGLNFVENHMDHVNKVVTCHPVHLPTTGSSIASNVVPLSEHAKRLAYSMAIIRFVNGFIDSQQTKMYAQSVSLLADRIGIPRWIVDLRHEVSHDKISSLPVLREAAKYALNWCFKNYWEPQYQQFLLARMDLRKIIMQMHYDSACMPLVGRQLDKYLNEEIFRKYETLKYNDHLRVVVFYDFFLLFKRARDDASLTSLTARFQSLLSLILQDFPDVYLTYFDSLKSFTEDHEPYYFFTGKECPLWLLALFNILSTMIDEYLSTSQAAPSALINAFFEKALDWNTSQVNSLLDFIILRDQSKCLLTEGHCRKYASLGAHS